MKVLRIQAILLVFIAGALACRLSNDGFQEYERVPVLTEEVIALSDEFEQAIQDANQKGTFEVEISERQLTSYVALNLEKSNQAPVTDIQIRLHDQQIWVSGVVHQDNLQLPLTIGIRVQIESMNNLAIEFSTARVGPFELPKPFLNTVAKEVEKALLEQVAKIGEGYVIEEITIGEGSILVRGTKR